MSNSKNLIGKVLLAIMMLSSFSVYCADANKPSAAGVAAAPINATGIYLQELVDAEDAYEAIPANGAPSVAEVAGLKDKLATFAQAFLKAQPIVDATGIQIAKDALTHMANQLENKPVVKFIKNTLLNPKDQAGLGYDLSNSDLITLLANPNAKAINPNTGSPRMFSTFVFATDRKQLDVLALLLALGANPQEGLKHIEPKDKNDYAEVIALLS
ncbi:MAG: hypothetical protein P4L22_02830 [Candidatus Babeliales bacterium]|nr:hypothetical protein [Candidatus Babeliales bacterium]